MHREALFIWMEHFLLPTSALAASTPPLATGIGFLPVLGAQSGLRRPAPR